MEKYSGELCGHHLSHMIEVDITVNKIHWHQVSSDMICWEGYNIISVAFVLKLHLIMGKYQINPTEGQNTSVSHERQRTTEDLSDLKIHTMARSNMWPWTGSWNRRRIVKKICKIQRVFRLVNRTTSILIFWLRSLYYHQVRC